jgi:hypothetical protein
MVVQVQRFSEEGKVMRKGLALLGTAALGAGVMFFADPKMGKRRLSMVGGQFVKAGKKTGRFFAGTTKGVKNRVYGLYCDTRSLLGNRCESSTENPRNRRIS